MALPTLLSLDEALRQAGVEHPEDIAGLSPAELGEMLCPLLFADDDLENAIREAQAQMRRQVLSKKDRRLPLPRVEVLQQPASQQQEHSWLDRAAKVPRTAATARQRPSEGCDENRKAAKAADRLISTLQKAMDTSNERRAQLTASLTGTHGPSSMHKAARAWTRL